MLSYFYSMIEDCLKCTRSRSCANKYKDLYTEQLNINTELAKRLNTYNSIIKELKDL